MIKETALTFLEFCVQQGLKLDYDNADNAGEEYHQYRTSWLPVIELGGLAGNEIKNQLWTQVEVGDNTTRYEFNCDYKGKPLYIDMVITYSAINVSNEDGNRDTPPTSTLHYIIEKVEVMDVVKDGDNFELPEYLCKDFEDEVMNNNTNKVQL